MKLQKCPKCSEYSMKETCPKCRKQTESAHYKYNGLRDAPKRFKKSK
jgi:rRNA maturation protein Nop10